jgi:hypothetical protein
MVQAASGAWPSLDLRKNLEPSLCKPRLRFPGNANFRARDKAAKSLLRLCRPLVETFATSEKPANCGQPSTGERMRVRPRFTCVWRSWACICASVSRIIVIDIRTKRVDVARRFGATDSIDSTKSEPVEAVRNLLPEGADHVFDFIGLKSVAERGSPCLAPAACTVLGRRGKTRRQDQPEHRDRDRPAQAHSRAMLLPVPDKFHCRASFKVSWLRSSLATRRVNGLAIFYKSVAVLLIRLQ